MTQHKNKNLIKDISLNEELQNIQNQQREYAVSQLSDRLKEVSKVNLWLSILSLIQWAVIAGLAIKLVLS